MNDLNQINTALERLFHEEGHRIVFWNDPEKEFQNALWLVDLAGVQKVDLTQVGALEVKVRLERDEPTTKFLLYAPTEEPDYENDWLLDVRLYGRSFRADRASILLQELGLASLHLRQHLADRRKFFDAKERLQKLKPLVAPNDSAADLDRKMIAVVAKADQAELFNLVLTIFHAWTEQEEVDLDGPPALWDQVEKFELDTPFWGMVKTTFGYEDDNPSLKKFILRLMLTDYAHHLKGEVPGAIRGMLLARTGWPNAVVCLAQWRDSSSKASSYDRLSKVVADFLNIEGHLPDLDLDQLVDVMTFLAVEKRIASSLRERVQTTADTLNADDVRTIARRRQAGHWASATVVGSDEAPRPALRAVYDGLVAAAEFFDLRNQHKTGFAYPDATAMFRAYETELYRFDQLYRHFCEAADLAEAKGWNILKPLRVEIEACYTNWFLPTLGTAWGQFIEAPSGLLAKWQIDKVPNQYAFYDRNVRPWLEESDNRRAFVIISDAFRYEAAEELAKELNGKYRFEATLTSQLGVLPSYTALGMASLLPHKTLAYKDKDILVDGKSSVAGGRDAILQSVGGVAVKAENLMAMKKDEGREFIKDKRVVYIYHDKIDAIGDFKRSEAETFQAVRETVNELAALVGHIVNNLNGYHIVVTADHGFLYSQTAPGETEKSKVENKPDGTVEDNRRYLVGRNLHDHPAVWHGKTSVTAGVEGDMHFWVPKGINRFRFTGSQHFVHGGAMPQEVAVPVLTVKHVRGKSAQDTKVKPVIVQVLGTNHRITTAKHRFQLMQMEPVGERVKPITLKVAVYEGSDPVTNIESVTFDSASNNIDERKKWVSLVLQDRPYNKKTTYRLVLRDAEMPDIELQSVDVVIDRTFTDDF